MPSSACTCAPRPLHSFPTRRSSDLQRVDVEVFEARLGPQRFRLQLEVLRQQRMQAREGGRGGVVHLGSSRRVGTQRMRLAAPARAEDRKSTRLNSSHVSISYAVFCLHLRPPTPPLFPYTTLFRSAASRCRGLRGASRAAALPPSARSPSPAAHAGARGWSRGRRPSRLLAASGHAAHAPCRSSARRRSEEHTSELQSRFDLVCRLLLAPAPPDPSTLSLHDALPICSESMSRSSRRVSGRSASAFSSKSFASSACRRARVVAGASSI